MRRQDGHLSEGCHRFVVEDGAACHVTAMTVIRDRAHAHVSHQHDGFSVVLTKRFQRPEHGSVAVQAQAAVWAFGFLRMNREEHVPDQSHLDVRCDALSKDVHRLAVDAGKARDGLVDALAVDDKVPLHQPGGERVAVDHLTPSGRPTVDAHPHVHASSSMWVRHQVRRASALGPCKRCTRVVWNAASSRSARSEASPMHST